ncbi:MAG: hypothetical protein K9M07_02885 [Simkaniaceae bacterium]|nr:hypothetical protein [Simkaniaceae bacterium]
MKKQMSDGALTLKQLNHLGIIANHDESYEDFAIRVAMYLNARQDLKISESTPAFDLTELPLQRDHLVNGYDIDPYWVPILVGHQNLQLWEAACAWSLFKHNINIPLIQFRTSFLRKGAFLGYSLNEVLSHEMIHAVRTQMQGKQYEELIAYRTSLSLFRRFLGPIFQNAKESLVYFLLCFVSLISSWAYALFNGLIVSFVFFITLSFLITTTGYGCLRLFRKQRVFNRLLLKLSKILRSVDPLIIAIRLDDDEINTLSKLSIEEIKKQLQYWKDHSLKWEQLFQSYGEIN